MALIIALMVVCVVCIGLLYNCLRRRAPVKDLELNDSKYDGEGDDEEESEEDDEETNTSNLSLVLEMLMPGRVGSPEIEVGRLLTNLSR